MTRRWREMGSDFRFPSASHETVKPSSETGLLSRKRERIWCGTEGSKSISLQRRVRDELGNRLHSGTRHSGKPIGNFHAAVDRVGRRSQCSHLRLHRQSRSRIRPFRGGSQTRHRASGEPRLPDDRNSTLFGDTVEELSGWYCFTEQYRVDQERWRRQAEADSARSQRLENPFKGFGRNDLCPCGSGKKFKKWCLATVRLGSISPELTPSGASCSWLTSDLSSGSQALRLADEISLKYGLVELML